VKKHNFPLKRECFALFGQLIKWDNIFYPPSFVAILFFIILLLNNIFFDRKDDTAIDFKYFCTVLSSQQIYSLQLYCYQRLDMSEF